jgi:large subunit ribosomal protein L4
MATINVYDITGKQNGTFDLDAGVFEAQAKPALIHQAVIAEQAALRRGTHKAKTRAEVRGGGKKPWRQKGTGRARQGSTRAPHWRHGGVVHGPVPQDHSVKLNRKMHDAAVRGALTSATSKLTVLESLAIESGKTKDMANLLKSVNATGKVLVILDINVDDAALEKTILSLRNLPNIVDITTPYDLSVYDILNANAIVTTKGAVDEIREAYAK